MNSKISVTSYKKFTNWLLLSPVSHVLGWWVIFPVVMWGGSFLLTFSFTCRTSEFWPFNRRREKRKWKNICCCSLGQAWKVCPMLSFRPLVRNQSYGRVSLQGRLGNAAQEVGRAQILLMSLYPNGYTNAGSYYGSKWSQEGLGLHIEVIFLFKKY